jgi:hypothetical protein
MDVSGGGAGADAAVPDGKQSSGSEELSWVTSTSQPEYYLSMKSIRWAKEVKKYETWYKLGILGIQ